MRKVRKICSDPDYSPDCFSRGEDDDEESIHQNDVQDVISEFREGINSTAKRRKTGPNQWTSPYKGVYQRGRKWVSEFRDPLTRRRIWLGTFESAEEAHRARFAKKREFERRAVEVDQAICSDPDATGCFSGGENNAESIHRNDVEDVIFLEAPAKMRRRAPNTNPYKGVYQKGKKWTSEIRHPITKSRIRLGTFKSAEAAHQAYVAKKLEFERKAVAVSDHNGASGETTAESIHRNDVEDVIFLEAHAKMRRRAPDTNPYKGAYKNGRKWTSEFRDPITKRRIWLGTFKSAEEAHEAHVAKKLKFERGAVVAVSDHNSASAGVDPVICSDPNTGGCFSGGENNAKSIHRIDVEDENFLADTAKMRRRAPNTNPYKGAYKNGRKWTSEIWNPITKSRIRLGTFKSAEEAHQAYVAKKLELQRRAVTVSDPNGASAEVDRAICSDPDATGCFSGRKNNAENVIFLADTAKMRRRAPNTNPYRGVYKKGRTWTSEIRHPITKSRIRLGTFKSAEAAHQAYVAKKLEFERRAAAVSDQNTPRKLRELREICPDPDDATNCYPGGEDDEKSIHQNDVQDVVSQEDPAKVGCWDPNKRIKYKWACKSGGTKWRSQIQDPITKRHIHLGTFKSGEDANQACVAKRLEFERRALAVSVSDQSRASVGLTSGENDEKLIQQNAVEDVVSLQDPSKSSCRDPNTRIRYKGAYQKGRKWFSEIRDPITKSRIRLGTFNSAEEAHQAYVAKKLEFERRAVAVSDQISALNKTISPYKGVYFKRAKWIARIRDPITKCVTWLGSFNSAEEAHQVYVAKKLEFVGRAVDVSSEQNGASADSTGSPASALVAESCLISATDGSSTYAVADEERLRLKQILQIPGDQELNSGGLMEIGSHIIDQNGYLLGEFSSLDYDLRICDTQGGQMEPTEDLVA